MPTPLAASGSVRVHSFERRLWPLTLAPLMLAPLMLAPLWLGIVQADSSTVRPAAAQDAQKQRAVRRAEDERINAINRLESPDGPALQQPSNGSALTGVMVDRTVTMAGKRFYRAFSQQAMGNPIIGKATITVRERPDARWGSQLWIMEGSRMYFRTQLSPRINEADRTAEQAVQTVEQALLRRWLEAAFTSDKDLGSEELF